MDWGGDRKVLAFLLISGSTAGASFRTSTFSDIAILKVDF